MLKAIADTHTIIWYIFADSRLSQTARSTIDNLAANGDWVGFSMITIVEIIYLIEKQRIPNETLNKLLTEINKDTSVLNPIVLDQNIALILAQVSRDEIPDLPDRLIAATALYYNIPIISRDSKIKSSSLVTIW
ncbi:type II toxin-antitoxin system VapC family toxin [Planktothrix mougeotii]|uniref:PIN domain-containing protein n=1 Tax=Planktothrix mougeotii LEGE 06226 TaxID=1828728 RepID=A0ABR9UAI7_9CYAN|nr:PIN domain-containing protein [Planktothrix mougeotii]MBE9143450.1 PIN domain-containing protein [Planktothrix mougeotii LEGE 06226]